MPLIFLSPNVHPRLQPPLPSANNLEKRSGHGVDGQPFAGCLVLRRCFHPRPPTLDTRALINEVVRDKLRVALPEYLQYFLDATRPAQDTRATVRDEVQSVHSESHQLLLVGSWGTRLGSISLTHFADFRQPTATSVHRTPDYHIHNEGITASASILIQPLVTSSTVPSRSRHLAHTGIPPICYY